MSNLVSLSEKKKKTINWGQNPEKALRFLEWGSRMQETKYNHKEGGERKSGREERQRP
jgi:hypothetical protein